MKISRAKLKLFEACAIFLVDFENDDWEEQIFAGESVKDHPYSIAVEALYGKRKLNAKIKELKAAYKEMKHRCKDMTK
jgi:hypothetical protein